MCRFHRLPPRVRQTPMTSGSPAGDQSRVRAPAFAVERVIGASHTRSGKPCQDEAGVWAVGDSVAVAVADGHGTSRHAEVGARLAVQVALAALIRFAEDLGDRSGRLAEVQKFAEHPLRVQLVREWAARVRSKAGDEAAPLVDYGSTLLFALATPQFLLIGQLGDGDFLLVSDDRSVQAPLPADPAAFADETPSLCLPEAWHSLSVRALPVPTREALLVLSTDGYSKSYATDEVFRQIGPDYLDLVRSDGMNGLAPHLRGFLEEVTSRGSGDDIAIALIHWPDPVRTQPETEAAPGVAIAESAEPAPPAVAGVAESPGGLDEGDGSSGDSAEDEPRTKPSEGEREVAPASLSGASEDVPSAEHSSPESRAEGDAADLRPGIPESSRDAT